MAQTAAEKKSKAKAARLWMCFRLQLSEAEGTEQYQRETYPYSILLSNRNSLDHCHASGETRGYLDWLINRGYALIEKTAKDKTAEVLRALAYFHENPPVEKFLGRKNYGLINKAKKKKKMVYGSPEGPIVESKKGKRVRSK